MTELDKIIYTSLINESNDDNSDFVNLAEPLTSL